MLIDFEPGSAQKDAKVGRHCDLLPHPATSTRRQVTLGADSPDPGTHDAMLLG
jgi:hypothetical protein